MTTFQIIKSFLKCSVWNSFSVREWISGQNIRKSLPSFWFISCSMCNERTNDRIGQVWEIWLPVVSAWSISRKL